MTAPHETAPHLRGGPGMRQARILAVEDTPHNLELMTYLLERHGHRVIGAVTGAEARAAMRSERPDLVILDVQLPDANGFDLVAEIRADTDLATVPTVAVTAYAMLGDRDHALAAGFDEYFTKPIDPRTFASAIEQFLPAEMRGGQAGASGAAQTAGGI